MAKLVGNKNNQMVTLGAETPSVSNSSTAVSQIRTEQLTATAPVVGNSAPSNGSEAITSALQSQAEILKQRIEELERLQAELDARYDALQASQTGVPVGGKENTMVTLWDQPYQESRDTYEQLALEQDRLNDRKRNLAADQYEYQQRAAEYGEILSTIPYQEIEAAAKANGATLTGGTKVILDTMQQRVEQMREKQRQINAKRDELAKRVEDYRNGVGNDTEESINREIAALTIMEQNLAGSRAKNSQDASALAGATAKGAESQIYEHLMQDAYDSYYNQSAMGMKYETEKEKLYAEWQNLNRKELETGVYGDRTASDVWDEIQNLEDEYQGYLVEAENYWAGKMLDQLSDSERKLINQYVEAKNNQSTSNGRGVKGGYTTAEEVQRRWNKLVEHFGEDRARELAQVGDRLYRAEQQAEQNKAMKQYAQEGFGQAVIASAASVVTNFISAPGALVSMVQQKIYNPAGFNTLDTNTAGFSMQNATRSLRGGVQEATMPDAAIATTGQKIGSMLYSTLMSGIDSYVTGAVLGAAAAGTKLGAKAAGAALGATAATNAAQDITERGGTVNQAILGGVAAGAFEMIFESVSLGRLDALKEKDTVRTVKDYLTNVAKSIGVNASEEAATETANILFDIVALGNASDYERQLRELMADNPEMSEQEAKRELAAALALQVVESAVSGALMGAVFGAIGSAEAMNTTKAKDTFANEYLLQGLIDQGLTYNGTAVFDMAADLQDRLNAGQTIPHEEITALAEQMQKLIDQKVQQGASIAEATNAESTEQMLALPEQVQRIEEKLQKQQTVKEPEALPTETTAGENTNVLTNEVQMERETVQTAPEETVEEAPMREAAATEQRKTVPGNDIARGAAGNAAEVNTEENTTLSEAETEIRRLAQMYQGEELRQAAQNLANDMRMAGETAYAEEIEAAAAMLPKAARTMNAVSANNVTAPAAGSAVQTEGVEYGGEAAGVSVRDGSERNDRQSAGGQTGRVAGEAGRTAETTAERNVSAEQSRDAKAARRMLRGSGQSTRAATGLKNASTSGSPVYVLEEQDMDAEAYEIVNDGEANGYRVNLVYGAMTFNGRNGKKVRADGVRSGDGLYIRMDAKDFTGRQIANHEMFHAMAEEDPGLIPEIMDQVISSLSEDEFERLMQAYEDLYGGVYDDYSRIVEELCADVYAGMDRANLKQAERAYADVTEKTEAVRGITERRTGLRAIGERGVRETRAGPEGKKNATAEAASRPTDTRGEVTFSLENDEKFMEKARAANRGAVPDDVMNQAERDRAEIRDIFRNDSEGLNLPEDIIGNTFVKDSAYGGSEENTTVCIRSLAADDLMDAIGEYLNRPLTVQDTLTIAQEYWKYTDKPECLYCYVAMDRKAQREYLGEYLKQRDGAIRDFENGVDYDDAFERFRAGRANTKQMRDRFAMFYRNWQSGAETITPAMLASPKRIQDTAKEHPELKKQINDALKYAQSASWAKKRIGYRAYNNHILRWAANKIEELNRHYGLRLYSFSDFSPAFILENMQMLTDAAVKGLKVLGYTKELDFVKIFAPSGMNINVSVFGYDDGNGGVVQDGMQGADWAEAQKLREQYPNVGCTFVATNDSQIEWALEQDWIDVIIPFHMVKTGSKVAKEFGWTNYTQMSADLKSSDWTEGDARSIYPEQHGNDKATYLEAIRENHLKPRFEKWVEHPNYMKLVNETRQSAADTKPVQPIFNVDAAKESIEAMRKMGGYYTPVGGSREVMQEIAEEISDKIRGEKTSFSLASGQSREQVEERVAELEGLMENLMTEQEMMDPAEFNVRWFNFQMEKAALESELYDLEQTEERRRLREEAKARREKAEELNPQIEARRKKAREYDREAKAAEGRYEKSREARELEEAKRLRERAKKERQEANKLQKELGTMPEVKNETRVYKPTEAMKRTEDRLLNLFKIQAGNRGETRQALTGVLLETLERGYVGQETVEAVLRQMYRTGIDVVPADELYKDIAATLKNRKIYVSNELKSEYGDDWGKVRGQLLGLGIYTTSDRTEMGVDSVYAELSGQYPGVFDEENVDMRGMLDEMLEYAGMGRTQHMTLAESALAQGLDSEEDFQNLYRLASEELARFADAAGVESRVLSKKEWQIAQEQAEHSEEKRKILKASRERAEEIRKTEQKKREVMIYKRQRAEQMDKLRRQITRLGRKFEQNDALTKVAMSNLDKDAQSLIRNAMETVDTISNGFRKSTQKDLLALQESVGLAKEQPGFEENALQIIKAELLRKAEYLSMEDAMVDQKAKERLQNAMNAMDRLGKVRLTDMSVEDLEAMYTAVQAIIHEIDSVDEMIGEEWDRTVTETANQIREEVGRAKGVSEKLRGEKISGARHLMAEQSLSPSRMLARLVGYDRSGAMGKVIREFEQGDLAAMKYALDADLKFSAFMKDKNTREWLKTATGKNAKMVTIEIPKVLEYGEGDTPIYDPKEKVSFQVSQMMLVQMSLDLQNEANTRHAEKGGYTIPKIKEYRKGNFDEMYNGAITVKIPRERLAQIVKEHLSAEGQEYARLLHSYYNGIGKTAINEVSQKLNGVDVARVKNYYPIHTNGDYRGREYNVFDATLEGIGSLKERQFSKTPILLEDAFESFRYHRDQMARYVGYAVARRNFVALLNHRVTGGKTLRAEIEEKWSATAGESIDEFFRIIETGQLEENKDILRNFQSKYASAVLSYNVGSMMKQLGALPMAGSTVGQGAILRGMLHPTKMGRKQREFIRLYTPYLDYRGKGYTYREMAEVAGKNVHSESLDKTFDYLLGKNWLEAMDIKVNTALWHAAEYAVKRDTQIRPGSQADIEAGIDPYYKAVADVFNRMTHDTQTNYNMMARPPVLMKQGLLLRTFTMFRTDAYQVAGALRENFGAWQQAKRNYKAGKSEDAKAQVKKTGKSVARTVTAVIGNAMIAVLVDEMRQLIRGNDDDFFGEDGEILWEEIGKRVGKEVLMNVAGVFMFVEELTEYIEAKITGDRYYEPEVGRVGMLVDAADSLSKLGKTMGDVFHQANQIRKDGGDVAGYLDHEWDAVFGAIHSAAQDCSFLLGVPLKNFERTITTALGWILPEAKIAYDDMFADYSKALLRDMSERELPYGIDAYLRDNCSITDDAVRDEYLRLYQAVGDEMMPGAEHPETITEGEGDEETKRELTLEEVGRWDSKYREIMIDETKRLIESEAYQNMTDSEKAKALEMIDKYAEQAADTYIGVDADAWVQRTVETGVDPVNMAAYKAVTADMKTAESYQWLAESGMTEQEAVGVLGVLMQDKDGYKPSYTEMQKALENGLTLTEWADLYAIDDGKVKSVNEWISEGVGKDVAILLAETTDGLEPEEGKSQVSNMQKYRAIATSGMTEEQKVDAMSLLLGMEMETESGGQSQRAKMLRVIESGMTVDEYLDLKESGTVEMYLKYIDTGLDRKDAEALAGIVEGLEPEDGKKQVSEMQKYRAAADNLDAGDAWTVIRGMQESEDIIEKLDAVRKTGVTPEQYLDLREGDQIDNYLEALELGLSKESAYKATMAVAALPELPNGESYSVGEKQAEAMKVCKTVEEQIIVYATYGADDDAKTTIAKFAAAEKYGATPMHYIEARKLAKEKYNEGSENLNSKEVAAALRSMDLTNAQRAALWQMFGIGWKKNPFGNTADIRTAYEKAKEEKKKQKE